MNKPTLYIMCGLSGSGKSTIATQIANEILIKQSSVGKKGLENINIRCF